MNYEKFQLELKKLIKQVEDGWKYLRWFVAKLKIILYGKQNKIFKQWDIVKVNFWYNIGSEINKERLAIIISPNFISKFSNNCIVVPLTSFKDNKKVLPDIHYIIDWYKGIEKSIVLINNIRDISKKRIIKKIWSLKKEDLERIKKLTSDLFKK